MKHSKIAILCLAVSAMLLLSLPAAAQAPPQAGGRGPGPGGRGGAPMAVDFADHTGFVQIFDGKTLNGWDGSPDIWSVQNGAITGLSCPDKPAGTTFIIYKGSEPADFELKLELKLENGNSGIQYRSTQAEPGAFPNRGGAGGGRGRAAGRGPGGPGGPGGRGRGNASAEPFEPCANHQAQEGQQPAGPGGGAYTKWNVQGYQFDFAGRGSGNLWEGGRFPGERGTVSTAGQVVLLREDQPNTLLATTADADELNSTIKTNDWNQIHIIARGYTFIHIINGRVFTVTVDDNAAKRRSKGIIAIQVEGTNMRVSARDIWLKTL